MVQIIQIVLREAAVATDCADDRTQQRHSKLVPESTRIGR